MGYLYQYIENNSVWKLNKSICYFFPFLQFEICEIKHWLQLLMVCVSATAP
jgi:hypothetical protein